MSAVIGFVSGVNLVPATSCSSIEADFRSRAGGGRVSGVLGWLHVGGVGLFAPISSAKLATSTPSAVDTNEMRLPSSLKIVPRTDVWPGIL